MSTEYCHQTGCLRLVLKPHIYCEKHEDKNSTPVSKEHQHKYTVVVEIVVKNVSQSRQDAGRTYYETGKKHTVTKLRCETCDSEVER